MHVFKKNKVRFRCNRSCGLLGLMMALITLLVNKKLKVILLSEKGKSEILHPTILLCFGARTTTLLNMKTSIYKISKAYKGSMPSGAGKGLKPPSTNSSSTGTNTNIAPTNINSPKDLTEAEIKEAFLHPKKSETYDASQYTTGAEKPKEQEKTSSISIKPKPITPFQDNKALFQDTLFDQQKKQAEQKVNKVYEGALKKFQEEDKKKNEEMVTNKISEETVKKLQEDQKERDEAWRSKHSEGFNYLLWKQTPPSIGAGAGIIATQNIYHNKNTPTPAIQPPALLSKTEEKTITSEIPAPPPAPIKPKILKNISGKEYTTQINETTTELKIDELIKELKSRELIKDDNGNTAVSIKVENGKVINVGGAKHNIKLTPLGQAYGEEYQKPTFVLKEETFKNDEDIELMIITPPKPREDTFVETGKQKHLLIAHSKNNDTYYAIGYLTSKKTGKYLSDIQFKKFQDSKEPQNNIKVQNYVLFNNIEEVLKSDVAYTEESKEYFAQINPDIVENLKIEIQDLQEKPVASFNHCGITEEDCLNICKSFDDNVEKKTKHPQTKEQIQQQQEAKEKQQEKQKEEKELKYKDKDKHDQNSSSSF